MIDAFLPLGVQIALLSALVRLGRPPRNAGIFYAFFNPAAFVALFTTLFFIFPEIYGVFNSYYLDGFPFALTRERFIDGEWGLVLFLLFVCLGQIVVRPLSKRSAIPDATELLSRPLTHWQTWVLNIFLVAGILANIYLSVQYSHSGGFRSSLVKTRTGELLTTVVYFGEFAVALLAAHAIHARRYILGLIVLAAFAASVTITGSRGRILWPAAIAVILLIARQQRMKYLRLVLASGVTVAILILLDPFTKYLTTGVPIDFSAVLRIDTIFEHRNFDGMSNFVLISQTGFVHSESSRWFSGANVDFMNQFFPAVLAQGVAYGVTVPGWFYMAGGTSGLIVGAVCYGMGLEYLNARIRRITSPGLLVGYLFAITWLAAVGGNFVGSLDKAVANFAPAVVYLVLTRTSKPSMRSLKSSAMNVQHPQSPAKGRRSDPDSSRVDHLKTSGNHP